MYLEFQVTGRDLRLFAAASCCKHVTVGSFVVAVFEDMRCEPSLFDQVLDAVVGFTQADAHFHGEFALAQVRLTLDEREKFVCDFFVHLSGTLPPLRVIFLRRVMG